MPICGSARLLITVSGQVGDTFSIPGSQSQTALDQLREPPPPRRRGANAQLVFIAPEGKAVDRARYAEAIGTQHAEHLVGDPGALA